VPFPVLGCKQGPLRYKFATKGISCTQKAPILPAPRLVRPAPKFHRHMVWVFRAVSRAWRRAETARWRRGAAAEGGGGGDGARRRAPSPWPAGPTYPSGRALALARVPHAGPRPRLPVAPLCDRHDHGESYRLPGRPPPPVGSPFAVLLGQVAEAFLLAGDVIGVIVAVHIPLRRN
jgi:hypothetical protein